MSSFEATRQITQGAEADTRVVFLSMYDDEDYLAECVDIGANGYILKESPSEQLVTAIREVHRGGSYLSPRDCSLSSSTISARKASGKAAAAPIWHVDQARARDSEAAGGRTIGEGNRGQFRFERENHRSA